MQEQQIAEEIMNKKKTTSDFYSEDKYKCSYSTYKKITNCFFKKLSNKLLYNGEAYIFPKKLGVIRLVKSKPKFTKKKQVDFHRTKMLGYTVYFDNIHTDGYIARFQWIKEHPIGIFTNKRLWTFKPTRTNKRLLAKLIKEQGFIDNYIEDYD